MATDKSNCISCMDLSCDWSVWRKNLKKNITGDRHFYWQDEATRNIAEKLNTFLEQNVCFDTPEEELIREMWDIATAEERKCLAMVLLKLTETS